MLAQNNAAWATPPAPRTDLESSLHKISGFFNKIRTVNASNTQELEKDAAKLRLDKYPTELGENLGIAASKLSKIVDIAAFTDFVGFLHRTLGPPFTSVAIPKILKSVDATGKVRTTLRVSLDLYIAGLLKDLSAIKSALKPVLDPSKSPPHATVKLLAGYRDTLKEDFMQTLCNYAEKLENTLDPCPRERDPLLLSEELQKIDEQNRERSDNIRAYIDICEMIGRKTDSGLVESAGDANVGAEGACASGAASGTPSAPSATSSAVNSTSRPSTPSTLPIATPTASPSTPKWSVYEHKLTSLTSAEQAYGLASSFPQDPAFIKKAQILLLEKPKTHMLPHYAQFLSLSPKVAEKVVPEVLKRAQESQKYLKYTAELVKIGVIPPHGAVDVLIKLTRPQLQAQQVYTFTEACGQFMVENELISQRVAEYTEFLRRQPASNPLERQLIDGTISYLAPAPSAEKQVDTKQHIASVSTFVQLLLYGELTKKTYKTVLKLMMKLKPGELCSLVPYFTDCNAISGDNIPRVAQLIGSLSGACARFGYQVLDDAVERFYTDLQTDNRQSLVSQAMLLGNLQAQGLLVYSLTVSILKKILEVPKDKFRLKLACFLISSTDASEFDVQRLLTALEEYKCNVAMDMDLLPIYSSALSHLQLHEAHRVETSDDEDEEEEEEEEVPLEDDGDDGEDTEEEELSDEDFEREFSEMVGESKPVLNEVSAKPVKPLGVKISGLRIARR